MASWVNLCEVVWPIGSIYMSFSSTSPASALGGTWVQLTNTFLYAANSSGTTGGSSIHSHGWGLSYIIYYGSFATTTNADPDPHMIELKNETSAVKTTSQWQHYINSNTGHAMGITNINPMIIDKTANTNSTSTLPPYTTVYCWRRTA